MSLTRTASDGSGIENKCATRQRARWLVKSEVLARPVSSGALHLFAGSIDISAHVSMPQCLPTWPHQFSPPYTPVITSSRVRAENQLQLVETSAFALLDETIRSIRTALEGKDIPAVLAIAFFACFCPRSARADVKDNKTENEYQSYSGHWTT
jgi:hypothetical protein